MTLIEVMTALLIMLLVAGAISRLLVRSWADEQVVNGQNQAQKTAQLAIDAVVDRIRAAASVASGYDDEITVAFGNGDTLTYRLQDGALQRSRYVDATGETTTDAVMPEFLTGLTFEYRQRNGAGWEVAALPSAADWVVVSVTAGVGKEQATETSIVKLRNKG